MPAMFRIVRRPFFRIALVALVALGATACEGTSPVSRDATGAPEIVAISPLKIPDWVGGRPTPYDGLWEGHAINEAHALYCGINWPTYLPVMFRVENGVARRVVYAGERAGADGYINPKGVFMANTEGKYALGQLFTGTIKGDRLDGEWRSGHGLCYGPLYLVRLKDGQRYCLDRLNGLPYATKSECRGIDRLLTESEYRAMREKSGKS